MRKQTKLVAVLSAAALLAMGASMTSFAAGWEKDDAGIWHYYDSDDEMVTDEWKKDGSKWFYLDEDGNMLTDAWADDDHYVGADGAMLTNAWIKTLADEDVDDPSDDGEHWYFFDSKGEKVIDGTKKINGKTYLFDEDGKMRYGWQMDGEYAYYYGGEDEGWRAENQWLWLEKSGNLDEDDEEQDVLWDCSDADGEQCDDEGWYWFQSTGKLYTGAAKKKINGRYYMFNDHGQMLYEWINKNATVKLGSNAQLDGVKGNENTASASDMLYYNVVEEGWRGDGWYELDGSSDMGADNDTDWYYIDGGEIKHAAKDSSDMATYDGDGNPVYVTRIKVDSQKMGKQYYAFNEKGQNQTGLQYINSDGGFYYYDEEGYPVSGKVSSVECDDDDYAFYFDTKNGKKGEGYNGEKDGYLYFNGKRLEADDDYRLYFYDGDVYLVNNKGKIQKATSSNGKKYDIENKGIELEDVIVKTSKSGKVESIATSGKDEKFKFNDASTADTAALIKEMINQIKGDLNNVTEDTVVSVPYIQLYDDDLYTYWTMSDNGSNAKTGWLQLNKKGTPEKVELKGLTQTNKDAAEEQ